VLLRDELSILLSTVFVNYYTVVVEQ